MKEPNHELIRDLGKVVVHVKELTTPRIITHIRNSSKAGTTLSMANETMEHLKAAREYQEEVRDKMKNKRSGYKNGLQEYLRKKRDKS